EGLLTLRLACDLLDLNHHEFRRIKRGETYQNIDDAQRDTRRRVILGIAFDEVSLLGCCALERALQKKTLQERLHVQADLSPEGFVVGFEDHPLRTVVQTGFEKKR